VGPAIGAAIGLMGGLAIAAALIDSSYASCAANAGGEAGFWCGLPAIAETALATAILLVPYPGVVGVRAVRAGRPWVGYALAILPGLMAAAEVLALSSIGGSPATGQAVAAGIGVAIAVAVSTVVAGAVYTSGDHDHATGAMVAGGVAMILGLLAIGGIIRG
jgi:hypothetical protein